LSDPHASSHLSTKHTPPRHYHYAIVGVNWGFERSVGIQSYMGRVMLRHCCISISAAKGRQNCLSHLCHITSNEDRNGLVEIHACQLYNRSYTPFIRYSRLSKRLYNRSDNRLYRVNGVLGSISTDGSSVYRDSHCDIALWVRAAHPFYIVPRSTQPLLFVEWKYEHQLSN